MWKIEKKREYTLYINQYIDLRLKLYDKKDVNIIYVDYKGYNVLSTMMIWEFATEYLDFEVKIKKDLSELDQSSTNYYLILDKLYAEECIDQICYFISENFKEKEWDDSYKIDWNYE